MQAPHMRAQESILFRPPYGGLSAVRVVSKAEARAMLEEAERRMVRAEAFAPEKEAGK